MRIARLWMATLLALVAAPALARPDTTPTLARRPTAADMLAVWPRTALAKQRGGRAVIRCSVSVQGALLDCAVQGESPDGAGFGAAAVALAPHFRMRPGTHDGQPVAGATVLQLEFPDPAELDPTTGSLLPGDVSGARVELLPPPPPLVDRP